MLVPLDGDLYLARLGGETVQLTDTEESELNPALSNTGAYVSFVRDRRLWVGETGGEAQASPPFRMAHSCKVIARGAGRPARCVRTFRGGATGGFRG